MISFLKKLIQSLRKKSCKESNKQPDSLIELYILSDYEGNITMNISWNEHERIENAVSELVYKMCNGYLRDNIIEAINKKSEDMGNTVALQYSEFDDAKTNIEQLTESCYNININNCEILGGTERFMLDLFIKINGNIKKRRTGASKSRNMLKHTRRTWRLQKSRPRLCRQNNFYL